MTDIEALALVQAKLLEPHTDGVTWASGLWTLAEVVAAFDQRQQEFLRRTGLLGGWQEQALRPGQAVQALETGTLQRVWHGLVQSLNEAWSPLLEGDRATADRLLARLAGGRPLVFAWEEIDTAELLVAPSPLVTGRLCLFGPQQPEAPQGDALAPVLVTVPDEWLPYVLYGVLATLLRKHGRGYDEPRARYCEARYAEGLEAAEVLAAGWART